MGVLVTGFVGKPLTGTTVHIVVVKTATGYATDPGHHGTGTIAAVYC
jgi:hypothetical protein